MIRFFRYLLLVLAGLFSFAGHLSATTVYPLQLNAQIIPPYSNCLGDMVAGNVTSIRVTGLLRDLKTQSYNVGIGMQVYQGSQLKFATKTNHTEVVTNNTIHNFNLKDLFSPNNITGRYDGDGYCLKEGGYEFVFQAFDGGNARLPLSEPVRIHVYLSQAEPPRIIAPANGECVNYNAPVNFVWMEGAVTSYNPNRSYRLEIVELPEQTENFDAKSYINNNSTKITVEGIPGNLNFYTFQNTAGKLVKGRSYLWRVQLYDKTQMVSDARTVYSTSSAVANGGYSEVYTFKYTNCDPFGQRVEDQIDESKKPEIVRVDSSEAFSTVVWKNDPENFPCGYIVCFNRADDTLSNWARVEVGPTDSTYTFKNVENGVQYLTHIIGIVDCQDDGTKMLSANSDNGSFTLPVPAEQECSTTIDGLTSQYSVENLSPNDYFTANDRNIKINKIDRFIEGSDTTFSGEGQVLCPWFPSISLTTKFEKVKINRNHELVKGVVYVPTDSSNSGFFDLDEMMNDNYTGDGPAEQMTGKFKEYSKTDDIPEGSLGVVNGELYAMVNGEPVDLGKVVEASDYEGKIQKENIDAKSGIVDFEAISYWNPPIDNDREKYTGDIDRYYTNYSTSSGNYTVPWFAMPDGSTAEIKAKLQVNDNFPLDKLKFVCLTGSQAVELNAQKTQESGDFVYYKLPIFGGEGETSLNLYAVATDKNGNNITLGRAQILSMPKFEQEVVLIPVQREASSIDQAAIEKKLNEIYKPLGIAYKVKVADKFDSEELEFMKDGLEVSGSGFLSTETDAMKQLKKLYAQNHTIEKDVAYIFVCPKAKYDGAEVKGDMPRSGQTGYVFSTAETYNDGWTIAHELGHGLYSFEHTFPHDKQGTTDNLMDYANGTNLKVWQWNLLYSHKNFTIPFLESDEDGMRREIIPVISETNDYKGEDYVFDDGYLSIYENDDLRNCYKYIDDAGVETFVPLILVPRGNTAKFKFHKNIQNINDVNNYSFTVEDEGKDSKASFKFHKNDNTYTLTKESSKEAGVLFDVDVNSLRVESNYFEVDISFSFTENYNFQSIDPDTKIYLVIKDDSGKELGRLQYLSMEPKEINYTLVYLTTEDGKRVRDDFNAEDFHTMLNSFHGSLFIRWKRVKVEEMKCTIPPDLSNERALLYLSGTYLTQNYPEVKKQSNLLRDCMGATEVARAIKMYEFNSIEHSKVFFITKHSNLRIVNTPDIIYRQEEGGGVSANHKFGALWAAELCHSSECLYKEAVHEFGHFVNLTDATGATTSSDHPDAKYRLSRGSNFDNFMYYNNDASSSKRWFLYQVKTAHNYLNKPITQDESTMVNTMVNTIKLNLKIDHVKCYGGATGQLTVNIENRDSESRYTYSYGDKTSSDGIFMGLSAGKNVLTVKSNKGCTTTRSTEINQPENLTAEIILGESTQKKLTVKSEVKGGTKDYIYTWGGDAKGNKKNADIKLTDVQSTYTVSLHVEDKNGCSVDISKNFIAPMKQ